MYGNLYVGLMLNYSPPGVSVTITIGILQIPAILVTFFISDSQPPIILNTTFSDFSKTKSWFGGINNEYVWYHYICNLCVVFSYYMHACVHVCVCARMYAYIYIIMLCVIDFNVCRILYIFVVFMNSDARHLEITQTKPFFGCIDLALDGTGIEKSRAHLIKYYVNSSIQKKLSLECLNIVRDLKHSKYCTSIFVSTSNMHIQQALMGVGE